MEKIDFKNGQGPYINDTNLNQLQDNVEKAIAEKSSLPIRWHNRTNISKKK